MAYSALSHLDCPSCHRTHDADRVQGTCTCGSSLLARYDLAAVEVTPAGIASRPPNLWRYHEVLPVRSPSAVVSLGEGMTPLLPLPEYGKQAGVPGLLMKDEGLVPTGTFKARGAAVGVSRAAELNEPYRIEGKKTMGYEIAEQLGWRVPDVIVYPTGGGVGIIGIHKALREMRELGWIPDGRLPRLVAVQATGCAPIVDAFERGATESEPALDAHTIAFGITVPKALGDFLVLEAVYSTGGTAIAVSDEEVLTEQGNLARAEGAFICPEGAACFAAVKRLRRSGWLAEDDEVVVLNTGAGIKYPETVEVSVPVLAKDGAIPPTPGPAPPGRGRSAGFARYG